ncbi:CHRD domain-containing protein [Nocardioides glacieisoli]|uniref:CHRD domain-containing protein n=1 Tax=Nocardioides glacieisoli TaxID=1168730 RepID=A0A4Q2RKT4_9ACTN|nr:CHRD domain-containing protein [Nocardioides glacieisoli]RYB89370.1 CHRD domain-containing protein [Nocardioides glacieisoli]
MRRVCATISWSDIDKPIAAHIHRRSDGQVVVDLTGSVTGGTKCATASRRLIRRIAEQPGRYYVNVHNRTYPAGAVQGSLGAHHM